MEKIKTGHVRYCSSGFFYTEDSWNEIEIYQTIENVGVFLEYGKIVTQWSEPLIQIKNSQQLLQ